jgi:hypothetical protein
MILKCNFMIALKYYSCNKFSHNNKLENSFAHPYSEKHAHTTKNNIIII